MKRTHKIHTLNTHKGDKVPLNTAPAEGFPFKGISVSVDRKSLNSKAWPCTAEYNTSGDSAHTHRAPSLLMGRDSEGGSGGEREARGFETRRKGKEREGGFTGRNTHYFLVKKLVSSLMQCFRSEVEVCSGNIHEQSAPCTRCPSITG